MLLDVKPWDDETDMAKLEASVRAIHMDGLLWGACESGGEWADGRMGGWADGRRGGWADGRMVLPGWADGGCCKRMAGQAVLAC